MGQFPERKRRAGDTSGLDPFKAELLERWQAGCNNIAHLWRDIQSEGFSGSYGLVYEYLAPLRRGEPIRPSALEACVPVAGIRRDEAAVRAALELPWSQGQVEGQITKLKLLKRQMYGRAKLDLLQQRLLHAA